METNATRGMTRWRSSDSHWVERWDPTCCFSYQI